MQVDRLRVMVYLALTGRLDDQDGDVLAELTAERYFNAIHWLEGQTYCHLEAETSAYYPSHLGISWAAREAPEELVKEACFTLAPTGLMNNPMILFPLGKPQR